MKLTVLVPSAEYRAYAGARIRYDRVRSELAELGFTLLLEDIGTFDPATADCDALLISKCHDARSLIAASALSDRGALVGVDLFDDYYSDPTDSRLLRYREWLGQLVNLCDFALCSTDVMADVAHQIRSDLPIHVLNDPAPDVDAVCLANQVERKLTDARNDGRLHVAWFGVGDNRYFDVGLTDLFAYSALLGELRRAGMDVGLTVLTNRRSLTADGLSLISRLPVKSQVREWSETAERELLRDAFLAFLPVNAQPFSRAKSPNRAFTALSAGSQVLSAGYPLYAALDRFIYRDAKSFVDDWARGSMRLSAHTVGEYLRASDALANAKTEAAKFATFLSRLREQLQTRPSLPVALVHGFGTRGEAHHLIRSVNGLSVASPYCSAPLDFDIVFEGEADAVEMLVSAAASARLLPQVRKYAKRDRIGGRRFLRVSTSAGRWHSRPASRQQSHNEPIAYQLATYSETMRAIERQLQGILGPTRVIFSETSALPFRAASPHT
jgi:hypothetical protein